MNLYPKPPSWWVAIPENEDEYKRKWKNERGKPIDYWLTPEKNEKKYLAKKIQRMVKAESRKELEEEEKSTKEVNKICSLI